MKRSGRERVRKRKPGLELTPAGVTEFRMVNDGNEGLTSTDIEITTVFGVARLTSKFHSELGREHRLSGVRSRCDKN